MGMIRTLTLPASQGCREGELRPQRERKPSFPSYTSRRSPGADAREEGPGRQGTVSMAWGVCPAGFRAAQLKAPFQMGVSSGSQAESGSKPGLSLFAPWALWGTEAGKGTGWPQAHLPAWAVNAVARTSTRCPENWGRWIP